MGWWTESTDDGPASEKDGTCVIMGDRRLSLDGRGGRALDSADSKRVPNLALADDSQLYVVTLEVGPLRMPFWVVRARRCFAVTGFRRVILSAPQYEKLILLFRPESSESLASSSSSGSGMIRGCAEVREHTTLPQGQRKHREIDRK